VVSGEAVVEGVVDDDVDEAFVDVMMFESIDCTLTISAVGSSFCDLSFTHTSLLSESMPHLKPVEQRTFFISELK
jgi:hypothetical protein